MNMVQAVETVFMAKYLKFQGRASRSEYWWWTLFAIVVALIFNIIDIAVLHRAGQFMPLSTTWNLVTFIPWIMVAIRRLHDTNRSGWWYLLIFTIIGIIPLIIWFCWRGDARENRFGPDPLDK